MEHNPIFALLIMIAGVVIVGAMSYYNGRRDGERRGAITSALANERALELQQQFEQEHERRELLTDELSQLAQAHHQVHSELARWKARAIDAELQIADLQEAQKDHLETLDALNRLNETAAGALELTVQQLHQAEARALLPEDVQHLQHAARQLGQHAVAFRRTGSQKVNHAEVAANHLQQLVQRFQPIEQQSEESSPRRAA
ncbi:hypothetical protein ACIPK7_05470 [Pseudomonas sp. NPDC086581]|uniref:hypothetical protein n=1 Tax=Pseudomonas sp. NPDC086581 TaxID=3364432 RepID=UPI00381474AA